MEPVVAIINPGSTSTRLALWSAGGEIESCTLSSSINCAEIESWLRPLIVNHHLAGIMGRGGLLKPVPAGVYAVNDTMLEDLRSQKYGRHASNQGGLLAAELGAVLGVPAWIADPVTSDEFIPAARVSGVPGIERSSRGHFLSIKATANKLCAQLDLDIKTGRLVIAHLGGGISVAAVDGGKIIDVNDALLGMGPFSPQRAGALPLRKLLDLAYTTERVRLEEILGKESGLTGYLGTDDLIEIERQIAAGDEQAELIVNAMVYQIAKEIGSMSTALSQPPQAIGITGGLARSALLMEKLQPRIEWLARTLVFPGENEMEALAAAAFRVLSGDESVKNYAEMVGYDG